MPDHPVITDSEGVDDLARRCRSAGRFALDFEFLWERTYRPKPCLAQVAVDADIVLVDPVAGAPLDALASVVADPAIETVMHAPSADLTLLALHFSTTPANLFDVQLAAGFVGYGAGQSLATLLDRVLGVKVSKAESYSDWSRRPLRAEQLSYAADDVRYLLSLRDTLDADAGRQSRGDWVAEEHELRYGAGSRFTTDPDEAWRRIKGHGRLNGRERAVLREVARWREQQALRRDRPPAWILQDRLALDIARRRPTTRDGLNRVRGLDEKLRDDDAAALLAAVEVGQSAEPIDLARSTPPDMAERLDVLVALGQLVIGRRAEAAGLAAPLLATRDDIEAFLANRITGSARPTALESGWRHQLAGEPLAALADGRLGLAPTRAHPYLRELVIDGP